MPRETSALRSPLTPSELKSKPLCTNLTSPNTQCIPIPWRVSHCPHTTTMATRHDATFNRPQASALQLHAFAQHAHATLQRASAHVVSVCSTHAKEKRLSASFFGLSASFFFGLSASFFLGYLLFCSSFRGTCHDFGRFTGLSASFFGGLSVSFSGFGIIQGFGNQHFFLGLRLGQIQHLLLGFRVWQPTSPLRFRVCQPTSLLGFRAWQPTSPFRA